MTRLTTYLIGVMFVLLPGPETKAGEIDLLLFQPGQSSWEWLLVPTTHDGGKRMREGKTCLFCHAGEEAAIGRLIASGEKIEPNPIAGLPANIPMRLVATFDDQALSLDLSWASPEMPAAVGPEDEEIHLTIMLGSPALNVASIAGCWAACHSDLPGMPDARAGQDLTKYLPASRNKMSRTGGGDDIKPVADLAAQRDGGQVLETWQVVLDQGQLVKVQDGYFLDARITYPDTQLGATAQSGAGGWSVSMVRPLNPSGTGRLKLSPGVPYTLAVALHENHASGRYHYVSFPLTFFLGDGEAELNASRK